MKIKIKPRGNDFYECMPHIIGQIKNSVSDPFYRNVVRCAGFVDNMTWWNIYWEEEMSIRHSFKIRKIRK